ncbi:AbiH family protein [Salinicoccus sp. HZC-1]|uniref:AbiH family protein n=1 Tax=Salinicoccus sp. HZC-1 TaxID=3385497 RepID=UPI00398AFA29
MSQLIIVGNGFDLAHGMNSSFGSFSNSISSNTKNQWLLALKKRYIDTGYDTWYNFEILIEEITRKWFVDYFDIVVKKEDINIIIEEINSINTPYSQIAKALMDYLAKEDKQYYKKLDSISKVIREDSYALNFNYTKLLKQYINSKNIHYLHGSLEEEFIVLGYKYSPRHKGMPFEARLFEKEILREVLNYRRYLSNKDLKDDIFQSRMNELYENLHTMFSGLGSIWFDYPEELDNKMMDETSNGVTKATYGYFGIPFKTKLSPNLDREMRKERLQKISLELNDYGEKNDFKPQPIKLNIELDKIEELLILGHSLEADLELIDELLYKMVNLRAIKMFVYDGENEKSIDEKIKTINKVSDIAIELVSY